ncbi:phage protein Gp13 family protein [Pseudomonas oryzihabitans]|uniref:phage protein Gp13 family protein n=1 Tax=Pseudomonas oryzihabitans TaxID=47885 RepID=UPI0015E38F0D|nr:phage protein Gp13 family protein [Pseudomonas psychrotolerans]MBA1211531.1 DUF2833 domain-containing protein [Pseudomonas psychrotolerans]
MRLHKANYLHLYLAAVALSASDREEMDRMHPNRDPVDVLTASSDDPTVMAISDERGSVLAVGGHSNRFIWFVHTEHAERLPAKGRAEMLSILRGHLMDIKDQSSRQRPEDTYHFTNVVSLDNAKHLRLLDALGAEFLPETLRLNGHDFKQFLF